MFYSRHFDSRRPVSTFIIVVLKVSVILILVGIFVPGRVHRRATFRTEGLIRMSSGEERITIGIIIEAFTREIDGRTRVWARFSITDFKCLTEFLKGVCDNIRSSAYTHIVQLMPCCVNNLFLL